MEKLINDIIGLDKSRTINTSRFSKNSGIDIGVFTMPFREAESKHEE